VNASFAQYALGKKMFGMKFAEKNETYILYSVLFSARLTIFEITEIY
jgi:hypothetical protein